MKKSKKMLAALIATTLVLGQSTTPMAATLNGSKINGINLKTLTSSTPYKTAGLTEFKITPPKDGTYTDPQTGFEATVKFVYEKGGAKKVTWSSNYPVYYVLVEGGKTGGNLYEHAEGSTGSTEINTPDNEGIGHGHATFYYSVSKAATVSSISVNPKAATILPGQQQQLAVTATMEDGNTKDVTSGSTGTTYTSADASIATVDENGLVTVAPTAAVGSTVNVTATNGGKTVTSEITVAQDPATLVSSLSVNPSTASVIAGKEQQLKVTATMEDGNTKDVTSGST
uniref:Ig-like domain-containing protein n=1 Tax=uncultured Clostridium sp. TaxID=59620 RepID=UPI0028E822AD